jgi:2-C-methyl-D-erythritol 2,4-cyclodiphosphate synthase
MNLRIGFGYDVHRLESGIPFYLGGIRISHHKGASGHSDADVLIHAICDALLGAAALGDIGQHFPDNDEKYHNIESSFLLKKCLSIVRENGYIPGNIDSTIALQEPKIASIIPAMRKKLAEITGIDSNCISVKATTEEKLGFTGREEGVAAYAVVILYKS